jgi:hypothetical protein
VEPALVIEPSRRWAPVVCSQGDDPEVGGELVGMIEALPLADLSAQPGRGERVDPAQASEPRDCVRTRDAGRELREIGLDLVAAGARG